MFGPLLTAFATSVVGTLLLVRWGARWGLVDHPSGDRKRHGIPRPVAGGGLALGVLAGSILFSQLESTWGALLCAAGMAVLGLDDDRHDRSALWKLSGQAALVALALALTGLPGALRVGSWTLSWWPLLAACAFLWVLALTNAFNLLDGSDGLAVGLAALLAGAVWSGGGFHGAWGAFAVAFLAGCCAFWTFNRPPARAFLGDGGSYFVGFSLGMLSLHAAAEAGAAFDLIPWALVFALPLGDTAYAILRRLRARRPIFSADRQHIHHRLEARWGTWPMLAALYVVALLCALIGLWWMGWWR